MAPQTAPPPSCLDFFSGAWNTDKVKFWTEINHSIFNILIPYHKWQWIQCISILILVWNSAEIIAHLGFAFNWIMKWFLQLEERYHFTLFHVERIGCSSQMHIDATGWDFITDPLEEPPRDYIVYVGMKTNRLAITFSYYGLYYRLTTRNNWPANQTYLPNKIILVRLLVNMSALLFPVGPRTWGHYHLQSDSTLGLEWAAHQNWIGLGQMCLILPRKSSG